MWTNYTLANYQAQKYIRAIRNTEKKRYATLYWSFLSGHTHTTPHTTLTEMGSQAVRLNLDAIKAANFAEVL